MGSDKIYMFGEDGGSKGADIMAMIPALMQNKGMDPNLVAALMNGNGNRGAWGGDGCWWIWIILLFFCWGGFGGNGFGGNGANGLPAQLNGDAGRELLMNAIQGNGTAINQLASSLNCSTQQIQGAICNLQGSIDKVAGQIGMTGQQVINSVQSLGCQIGNQIADCCCQTQNAITRMGYENQLSVCNQTNTLVNTMNGNTLSLRDGNLANTQAILNNLNEFKTLYQQDKMDRLTSENLALKGQLSQSQQNQYIAATVQANTAPIVSRLNSLQGDVDGIKCKMPPTVAVPYPQLRAYNPEVFGAAAYGAVAGEYAAGYNGCGC